MKDSGIEAVLSDSEGSEAVLLVTQENGVGLDQKEWGSRDSNPRPVLGDSGVSLDWE